MTYGNLTFILENDQKIVLPISKSENGLFGVGIENVPEGFKMYNHSFSFGSIGALIFCECYAQKMHETKVKKIVITPNQCADVWDYLAELPENSYLYYLVYNVLTGKYENSYSVSKTNKDFPPTGIELVPVNHPTP